MMMRSFFYHPLTVNSIIQQRAVRREFDPKTIRG